MVLYGHMWLTRVNPANTGSNVKAIGSVVPGVTHQFTLCGVWIMSRRRYNVMEKDVKKWLNIQTVL